MVEIAGVHRTLRAPGPVAEPAQGGQALLGPSRRAEHGGGDAGQLGALFRRERSGHVGEGAPAGVENPGRGPPSGPGEMQGAAAGVGTGTPLDPTLRDQPVDHVCGPRLGQPENPPEPLGGGPRLILDHDDRLGQRAARTGPIRDGLPHAPTDEQDEGAEEVCCAVLRKIHNL